MKIKKQTKIALTVVGSLIVLATVGLYIGVDYLYQYAIIPGEKDFLSPSEASGGQGDFFSKWKFIEETPIEKSLMSRDDLHLKGTLLKHEVPTKKLAIMAHGYGSESLFMEDFAEIGFNMGFDVFLPDARGHGESEGDYIGFGWHERLDIVDWMHLLLEEYGSDVEIFMFGISMGASTVMMASGEDLPDQVKVIVEDCGYDSVKNELSYQLKDMFNLPAFPLIPLASIYTENKVGYNFNEASATEQLKNNQLPILFIHGTKDDFVPTEMVHSVYEATQGPKELWLVEGGEHATNHKVAPEEYREKLTRFVGQYIF